METLSDVSAATGSELRLSLTANGGQRWLVVEGDLDRHTSRAVERCLASFRQEAVKEVVMDLTPLRRFDEAGVAVLLEAVGGPWELRWRRPIDDAVAESIAETLLTDFFVAVDSALTRAEAANRLRSAFERVDEDPAPSPTSVVWIARAADA